MIGYYLPAWLHFWLHSDLSASAHMPFPLRKGHVSSSNSMTYPGVQVPYLSYRGATGNRLAQDPLAYSGLQRLLSQEIDLAPQEFFQLVPQS